MQGLYRRFLIYYHKELKPSVPSATVDNNEIQRQINAEGERENMELILRGSIS